MKRLITMMTMASISMMTLAQEPLRSGLDLTDFDTSVRPGDDFYEYACGGWMKKNPLPAAYSRYGSFDQLQENNDKRINGILAELQANTYEAGTILDILYEQAPYSGSQFYYAGLGADEKNATQNILSVYQGGLSLGQKEYYLDNDKATADIREAFKKHIVNMFQLFGFSKSSATKKMQNVMKIETALAKVSKSLS